MFQNNLLMGAASISGDTPGYTVDYSCRFNDNDSAYLQFTPTTNSAAQKTFTVSAWYKIGNLGLAQPTIIGAANASASVYTYLLTASYSSNFIGSSAVPTGFSLLSTVKATDPTAWYHAVIAVDTTESVAVDRWKFYLNGIRITSWSTETLPSLNSDTPMNNSSYPIAIGRLGAWTGAAYMDGYLSQVAQVSELALAPTDFGEFDANNVWRPIDITGLDYSGTNSFLLDFADSSNLGNDVSGNDNDFASTGLAANDQMIDTPTTNWCTWNNLFKANGTWNYANGNLDAAYTSSTDSGVFGTIGVSTGKWYWEMTSSAVGWNIGIVSETAVNSGDLAETDPQSGGWDAIGGDAWAYARAYSGSSGVKINPSASATYGEAFTTEVMGVALDLDNDIIWFSKSGTYQNSATIDEVQDGDDSNAAFSGEIGGQLVFPFIYAQGNLTVTANFGQSAFAGTQPTGFKKLNTANLPEPTIKDGTANFQTTLYTGNGSVRNIDQTENSTFQPDFVWLKNITDGGSNNMLFDAARGVTKVMATQLTAVEATDANSLTSFDSDGFGLGTGAAGIAGGYNINTKSYFAYQWLAGGGAGSANTDGTINTTTTTVNTAAGISIGTYTGTGSAATIGHGLGAVPKMIIVKERANDAGSWFMYHAEMSDDPETDYMLLDSFSALVDDATVWNDTAPTSTVFSIGTHDDVNGSTDTYVYYAFAEVEGFSKFGSYTGNGSADGAFIYTGFKPALITYKSTASAIWPIFDSARNPYNAATGSLVQSFVNYSPSAQTSGYGSDFLSSGFKLNSTDAQANGSGQLFVYWTFAEYPFGGSGITPATAF